MERHAIYVVCLMINLVQAVLVSSGSLQDTQSLTQSVAWPGRFSSFEWMRMAHTRTLLNLGPRSKLNKNHGMTYDTCIPEWCPLFFCRSYDNEPVLTAEQLIGDILHTGDGGTCQYTGGAIFSFIINNASVVLHIQGGTISAVRLRVVMTLDTMFKTWCTN